MQDAGGDVGLEAAQGILGLERGHTSCMRSRSLREARLAGPVRGGGVGVGGVDVDVSRRGASEERGGGRTEDDNVDTECQGHDSDEHGDPAHTHTHGAVDGAI